jgi:hypothetical protein
MAFEFDVELCTSATYEPWVSIKDGKMELELVVNQ